MCDTLVIVENSRVLFAKNSDRDPNEGQSLHWQQRAWHTPYSRRRCTHIEIPQVEVTAALLVSCPFWMWGAEMGANEHGVVIGNEAVFTRQPVNDVGLTGMDLVRLALERATSAARAVETIIALIEEFGQGGGCGLENRRLSYHNSFLIADPRTAFVLETAGRLHAVEEVRGVRGISNGLTIPGFARAHSDVNKTRNTACQVRRARTEALGRRSQHVGDLMALLADHGAGHAEPEYSWLSGAISAPCMHAGGVTATSQTTASWISELTPQGESHWVTGTAAPCLSLFKPAQIDSPIGTGPVPQEVADADSLWWRNEQLHRRVMRDPAQLRPRFIPERDEIQRAWLESPPTSQAAFRAGDDFLRRATLQVAAQPAADTRPLHVRRYWAQRNRRAGLHLESMAGNDPRASATLAGG